MENQEQPKKKKGFAAISPERRREIASKGGKAAHAQGTAHRFTEEEARVAGRKGGVAPHVKRGRGPKKLGPQPGVKENVEIGKPIEIPNPTLDQDKQVICGVDFGAGSDKAVITAVIK